MKLPSLKRKLVGHRKDGTPVYSRSRLRDWLIALLAGGRGYIINIHFADSGINLAPDNENVLTFNNIFIFNCKFSQEEIT